MADTDLLEAARSGDDGAFAALVAPYRRELHVHCYRGHLAAALSRSAAGRTAGPRRPGAAGTAQEAHLVRQLTQALVDHDIDAVVCLLADDVRIAMPPLPAVWQGRDRAASFLTEVAFRLVPRAHIAGLTRFETATMRPFGLPSILPYDQPDN